VPRFADREAGQALLAEAIASGAAETVATLVTGAGEGRFRVSLWRQRGGERIRLLAAFASVQVRAEAPAHPGAAGEDGEVPEGHLAGVGFVARALRGPLGAAMGLAERLRGRAAALSPEELTRTASDILAAGWRMTRLLDDLLLTGPEGAAAPPRSLGEVDAARLVRRLLRLAEPGLAAGGVRLAEAEVPAPGAGPLLLADESALWTAFEGLIAEAGRRAAAGGEVLIGLDWPTDTGGLAIAFAARPPLAAEACRSSVAAEPAGLWPSGAGPDGSLGARLVAANGGTLETGPGSEGWHVARVVFPASRLLDPA
jgi:signal transduction histidine kinase